MLFVPLFIFEILTEYINNRDSILHMINTRFINTLCYKPLSDMASVLKNMILGEGSVIAFYLFDLIVV